MRLRPLSPTRYVNALRRRLAHLRTPAAPAAAGAASAAAPAPAPAPAPNRYADLYEDHALTLPPDSSIGDGDFDQIGQIELAIRMCDLVLTHARRSRLVPQSGSWP